MDKKPYAESVTHALRRVHYLLEGVRELIVEQHDELAGLQLHFIQQLRQIREQLWDYRHDVHLYKAMDHLEKAEVAIRDKLFSEAYTHLNAAYSFMSRLALRANDLTDEMELVELESREFGMSSGLMIGFMLGISVFILNLILRILGY